MSEQSRRSAALTAYATVRSVIKSRSNHSVQATARSGATCTCALAVKHRRRACASDRVAPINLFPDKGMNQGASCECQKKAVALCSAVQCSAVMHRSTRAHTHTHARCIRSRCVATLSHRCTSAESATRTRQSRTKQVSACAALCMLHVECCMLHLVCCMLHVVCCMLQVRSCAAAPQL